MVQKRKNTKPTKSKKINNQNNQASEKNIKKETKKMTLADNIRCREQRNIKKVYVEPKPEDMVEKIRQLQNKYPENFSEFENIIPLVLKQKATEPSKGVTKFTSSKSENKIEFSVWNCPSCGVTLKHGQGASKRYKTNWCNNCGQKIDWSKIDKKK